MKKPTTTPSKAGTAKAKQAKTQRDPVEKGPEKERAARALIARDRHAAFSDEQPDVAFAYFRPIAERVPLEGLQIFTGNAMVMRSNVLAALGVMEPYLVKAVMQFWNPRLSEIFELPALTMALSFAVSRVPTARMSTGEIDAKLSEGAPWRELILSYLEVASNPLLNLVPAERVATIRAGHGKLDMAQDFVAVVGLLGEFSATLANKHPFPTEKLQVLSTLGGELSQTLKPGRAAAKATLRTPESVLRDQLGTLVADRYDHFQVLASVALGHRRADELLPALRSASPSSPAAEQTPTEGKPKPG